jgi:hypothetical protein
VRKNSFILSTKIDKNSFSYRYLVGVGGVEQFKQEAETLGLTKKQIDYVNHYVTKHEGGGLYC